MSGASAPSSTGPPMDADAHEELLGSLHDAGARSERIGDAAMDCLLHLLDIEHPHLAVLHACRYESFWDDGRKLEILERMAEQSMGSFAIQFCHAWKLSKLCEETKPDLYRELFPKLPPRTDKKERP